MAAGIKPLFRKTLPFLSPHGGLQPLAVVKPSSTAPELCDAELLDRALRGDKAAYGLLVSRYQTLVTSLAYSICGNFAYSEDIAQETFITAWQQLSKLQEPGKFKAWLCGITRNLAHNFVRRRTARAELHISPDVSTESIANAPSPTEHAITREESAIVWRALEQLPDAYREPLILFYREHQSVERVAAALDLSPDTVRQRLSRGRILLRGQVENVIERSLGATTPGVMFTTTVLSALPILGGPTIAALSHGGLTKVSAAATKFLPSFLAHAITAHLGRFYGSRRKTFRTRTLFIVALVVWATIAALVVALWLTT